MGGSIRAVVPMKPLLSSKGRLAGVLDPHRRAVLSLWMLGRVLGAVRGCAAVGEVAVVGGDVAVARLCTGLGASWEPDPTRQLNAALQASERATCRGGWQATLFVAGDLPFLTAGAVSQLAEMSAGRRLVFAPAARGGTNAILVPCGLAFRFQMGDDSFHRHRAQAERLGIAWQVIESPALGADVDVPDDLARLEHAEPQLWQMAAAMERYLVDEPFATNGAVARGRVPRLGLGGTGGPPVPTGQRPVPLRAGDKPPRYSAVQIRPGSVGETL